MAAVDAFTLTAPLTDPAAARRELFAHPELLWGHLAPDLKPGRDYASHSMAGTGGAGRIQTVAPDRIGFTWGSAGWRRPGRFIVRIGGELAVEAEDVPRSHAAGARAHWERMLTSAAGYLNQPNPSLDAPVRAVLFDADGVLQLPRAGWLDELTRIGGPTFVEDAFRAELECLTGADLRPRLEALLAAGTGAHVDEVLGAWHEIDINDESLALVGRLRRSGLLVGLATNQQSYRGAQMRSRYGIDRHFDHVFYSYELGHAKPSAEFYGHIVAALGLPPGEIAFVDDSAANVRGARVAGLRSALHRASTGAAGLASDLIAIGVPV